MFFTNKFYFWKELFKIGKLFETEKDDILKMEIFPKIYFSRENFVINFCCYFAQLHQ